MSAVTPGTHTEAAALPAHRFRLWYCPKRHRPGSVRRTREVTVRAVDRAAAHDLVDRKLFMTRWHVDAYLGVDGAEDPP